MSPESSSRSPERVLGLAPDATGLHIALYVPSLIGGGAENSTLKLAGHYAGMGYRVDLVLNRKQGAYLARVPEGIRVIELKRFKRPPARTLWARFLAFKAQPTALFTLALPVLLARKPLMDLRYLPALLVYLRQAQPQALISALTQTNLLSIWARKLSGVALHLVISERSIISMDIANQLTQSRSRWRWRYLPALVAKFYPQADSIVTLSKGAKDDLASFAGLPPESISVVYNPVVDDELSELAGHAVENSWFASPQAPVILAAGKLMANKDFPTLLKAFAELRKQVDARLVILGEGDQREYLRTLAESLQIQNDLDLIGWADNPYKFMAKSAVFVSSSTFEGFSRVLVEAMACGCSIVSADCPGGPREILNDGEYGKLVPVGNAQAMSQAILQSLKNPMDKKILEKRAAEFSVRASAQGYLNLITGRV